MITDDENVAYMKGQNAEISWIKRLEYDSGRQELS